MVVIANIIIVTETADVNNLPTLPSVLTGYLKSHAIRTALSALRNQPSEINTKAAEKVGLELLGYQT